jgi:hypothetical protein
MAVLVNKNTAQYPLSATGNTGAQSIALIPAARIYVKVPDPVVNTNVTQYAQYTFKTNGVTPTVGGSWVDLGITLGPGKFTYNKVHKRIETGIDKVTRLVYIEQKTADIEFILGQLDDYLMTNLGFQGSVVTAGSAMNFQIGTEDVVEKALLVVYANKLDGKELHWYHPSAKLAVTFEMSGEQMAVKVNADLVTFTPAGSTADSLVSVTEFA